MRDLIQVVKNKVLYIAAHKGFRRYAGNTGWLMGGQMLRMGINLFVAVAVARYLGPADFGLFNYVTAIVALVAVISGLGLQQTAKRDMVEDPERRDEIIGTCFILNTVVSVLCYALMLTVVGVSTQSTELLALFSLLGAVVILQPFNFIEQWFQSQVRARLSVISASIALVLFAVLKVAAIILEGSLVTFAYLSILEGATIVTLKIYFYRKHYGHLKLWSFHKRMALSLLKHSWPLIFSGLAFVVYAQTDKIMLGVMLGDQAVGEYSVASTISRFFGFIPAILGMSLFPAMVNAKKISNTLFEKRLLSIFQLIGLLGLIIALGLHFFSSSIIGHLFGESYYNSNELLAILAWVAPFGFVGNIRNQSLVAIGANTYVLYFTVIGAALNFVLNFILISYVGLVGACIATVYTYAIMSLFITFLFKETRQIGFLQLSALNPFSLYRMHRYPRWP